MTPLPEKTHLEWGSRLISKDFDNRPVPAAVHFTRHYKEAVIVSKNLSRTELRTIYKAFQRLRYWVFLKKDVPNMCWALTKEKIIRAARR